MQVVPALNLFLKAAFNGYQYGEGCEPKCIGDNYGAFQHLSSDIPRAVYVWFFIPERAEGDGGYIHPLPLQVMVAGRGAVVGGWRGRCVLGLARALCAGRWQRRCAVRVWRAGSTPRAARACVARARTQAPT
jgi:hypothetical protein